ncbi:MAG: tol-pal system protein YbgF [Acidobacteria bacterium RBG_16_68_9]|nr:MAG: tol-pal system protein YbgF [Acidobacteria bacterium RBG_16_68_9]
MTDLERRVASLEARLASAPGAEPMPGTAPPSQQPPGVSSGVSHTGAAPIALRAEEAVLRSGVVNPNYRNGVERYRAGDCEQAMANFRQFIKAEPTSDLADNAQYWIGECYYARKDFNRAIIELNEVFTKYPKGDRVPGALLALATSFADSGDDIDARLILQKLINDHPGSEEAEIGRQKLKVLTQ